MTPPPLVLAGQYGSPYTLKMRGVLRYRRIPFRWMLRDSKWDDLPDPPVPIIPVIAFPDGAGSYRELMVDSSPQIMRLERDVEGRSIVPRDPALAFVDELLEDVADEWLTKAMYHYRWAYEADIVKAGTLLPISRDLQLDSDRAQEMYDHITRRQIGRRALVGSTDWNAPIIEASYRRTLEALQAQLSGRDFLLGDRPGRCDFGMYGQLTQLVRWDPTPTAIAVEIAPKVVNWVERMDDLSWLEVDDTVDEGGWSSLDALDPGARDLLAEAGRTYAPFMVANAAALQAGADEVVCEIDGREYRQAPFKYQGKCLIWLRERYASLATEDRARVDDALAGTGCEALFA